jgi:hypothetical protein
MPGCVGHRLRLQLLTRLENEALGEALRRIGMKGFDLSIEEQIQIALSETAMSPGGTEATDLPLVSPAS